jgi:hypothetical protein
LGAFLVRLSSSYSKKDLLHLLRQARPDSLIVDEPDLIVVDGMFFRLSRDRLIEVQLNP